MKRKFKIGTCSRKYNSWQYQYPPGRYVEGVKTLFEVHMNSFYFILDVEPHADNPLIAHVSRAVSHIWVLSTDIDDARDIALRFLKADCWELREEKDAYLITPDRIEGMGIEELSNYQTAQSEGIKAKFYYWHRSE